MRGQHSLPPSLDPSHPADGRRSNRRHTQYNKDRIIYRVAKESSVHQYNSQIFHTDCSVPETTNKFYSLGFVKVMHPVQKAAATLLLLLLLLLLGVRRVQCKKRWRKEEAGEEEEEQGWVGNWAWSVGREGRRGNMGMALGDVRGGESTCERRRELSRERRRRRKCTSHPVWRCDLHSPTPLPLP